MYKKNYEKIDKIVESIRQNSNSFIIDMNNFYGDVIEYKQPSMKNQIDIITDLIARGANVEVINAPVGIAECKGKDVTIEIKSRKYTTKDDIEFEKNTRSVFFLAWVEANKIEDGEFMGLIRFNSYEDEYKLKDLSVSV